MKFCVVTTNKNCRGVFAGEVTESDLEKGTATIKDARMCVYWSTDTKGVVGLAAGGPTNKCRVTAPAPEIKLMGVTSIMEATDEAKKAWESEPWG